MQTASKTIRMFFLVMVSSLEKNPINYFPELIAPRHLHRLKGHIFACIKT